MPSRARHICGARACPARRNPGVCAGATRLGRYLEECVVGDVHEHFPGRTITEADNINFSLATVNFHPIHCDRALAKKSEFRRPLVNSGLSLSVVLGVTVSDVSIKTRLLLGSGVVVRMVLLGVSVGSI